MPREIVMHFGLGEKQHSDCRGDIKDAGLRKLNQYLGEVHSRQKNSDFRGRGVTAWLEQLTVTRR